MKSHWDLDALHVFYLVGRLGGVGTAARALRITQPAVSQRLASLERCIGKKLYGRVGRSAQLTEDGRKLYASCRDAFAMLDSVESAFADTATIPLAGSVRIASLSEAAKAFLLPKLLTFQKRYPAVSFELVYRLPYEMLPLLMRGQVDFVVTNEAYRRPQLEMTPRWVEEVVCIGPRPGRRLGWKQLAKMPWMAYGVEDPLWYELEKAAQRRGVRLPKPMPNVADVDTLMRLAAAGAGHALVPEHALRLHRCDVAVYPLPLRFRKNVYLGRVVTMPLGRAAQLFWDFLKEKD